MKRILIIFMLALTFTGEISAINQDTVTMEQRTKAYKHFRLLKDTTTVRTWMNMLRMNNALIEVVNYDNKLFKTYRLNDSVSKAQAQLHADKLISRRPSEAVKTPVTYTESDREYLIAALAACGIVIIILIVLLIMRSINLKHIHRAMDESEENFNNKIKHMESLEAEVRKMKIREKETKAELEKGIVDYQGNVQQLRLRIGELAEENTRLENILATHQAGEYSNDIRPSEEAMAIKQELIDKIETMLTRLKELNA